MRCMRPVWCPVELIPPGSLPARWEVWKQPERDWFTARRPPDGWWLIVEGIAAGNGSGDPISQERAARYVAAFTPPHSWQKIHGARLYDDCGWCQECDQPYCRAHWNVTSTGYGYCPAGHGKSLDPHW